MAQFGGKWLLKRCQLMSVCDSGDGMVACNVLPEPVSRAHRASKIANGYSNTEIHNKVRRVTQLFDRVHIIQRKNMTLPSKILGFAALSFLIASSVQAQTYYVPVGKNTPSTPLTPVASAKNFVAKRLGLDAIGADLKSITIPPAQRSANFPECSPAPTTADLGGSYRISSTQLTRAAALKLNIPVGNIATSANDMVFVQDYARTKECLASDGQTTVLYGQTIRTIITIKNTDVQAGLTLPVIAANATISGKNNSIEIQILGFENPQIPVLTSKIFGHTLTVETYEEFSKIQSDLVKLTADPASTPTVARIGVIPEQEPDDPIILKNHVVTTFALQQIKDGISCNAAKSRFKLPSDPSAKAIEQTYNMVMTACSSTAPSPLQKAQALDYLQGLQVKYAIW